MITNQFAEEIEKIQKKVKWFEFVAHFIICGFGSYLASHYGSVQANVAFFIGIIYGIIFNAGVIKDMFERYLYKKASKKVERQLKTKLQEFFDSVPLTNEQKVEAQKEVMEKRTREELH